MPFPKKPLVQKRCPFCGRVVFVKVRRAVKFKFCSNKCKELVKSQSLKGQLKTKLTPVKCSSVFCTKGKYLRPWQLKASENHFCSLKCSRYFRSKQYKLDIEALQERKQLEVKHNIWRI